MSWLVQTTVSGISGNAELGSQLIVCSSDVYILDAVLLPALNLTLVPSIIEILGVFPPSSAAEAALQMYGRK